MRRLDRRAITELGIPGATLMENAGRGAAAGIVALLGRLKATRRGARVAVVCGKGGNGGDGFVVARWLKRSGVRPDVLLAFPEGEIGGDAGGKLRELRRSGVRPWLVEDAHAAAEALARADVIVDALLGTGSRGAPEGRVARLIELINASGRPVAALDVPSGVSADGDPPAGPAIRATLTLTFGGFKRGLVCGPGAALAGRVEVVPIGIPAGEVLRGVATFVLDAGDAAALGPGIGLDEETRAAARALVQELPKPMAVDADGLSALAGHLEALRAAPAARVLTPHPGEMARLLAASVPDVQRARITTVREFATRHGAHVVLKGAWSVIGDPEGRVFVNPTGNPGIARGGARARGRRRPRGRARSGEDLLHPGARARSRRHDARDEPDLRPDQRVPGPRACLPRRRLPHPESRRAVGAWGPRAPAGRRRDGRRVGGQAPAALACADDRGQDRGSRRRAEDDHDPSARPHALSPRAASVGVTVSVGPTVRPPWDPGCSCSGDRRPRPS